MQTLHREHLPNGLTALAILMLSAACLSQPIIAADSDTSKPRDVPAEAIGYGVRVIGRFGLPIGQYLTLQGRRRGSGRAPTKMGAGDFQVERVNGRPLNKPFAVWVDRVKDMPPGTSCTVTGYETGAMIGVPPDVERRTKQPLPQAVWQFSVRLVVLNVTAHS